MIVKLELEFEIPEEELRNDETAMGMADSMLYMIKRRGYATDLGDQEKRLVVYVKKEKITYE